MGGVYNKDITYYQKRFNTFKIPTDTAAGFKIP